MPLKHHAPFDVARYYESIDHEILLEILRQRGASAASAAVVADYLRLPDRHRSGRGMTAGGSLSPLLAAVMLIPLDEAMNRLWRCYGLFYVRYMDDFVIMAPTRSPHAVTFQVYPCCSQGSVAFPHCVKFEYLPIWLLSLLVTLEYNPKFNLTCRIHMLILDMSPFQWPRNPNEQRDELYAGGTR